jgi:hypothetical protein
LGKEALFGRLVGVSVFQTDLRRIGLFQTAVLSLALRRQKATALGQFPEKVGQGVFFDCIFGHR